MTGDTRDRTAGLLASGAWRTTEIDNTYDHRQRRPADHQ